MALIDRLKSLFSSHEARLYERVITPKIEILVENARFRSEEWSLGGGTFPGMADRFRIGEMISGQLEGPGETGSHPFTAEIVRQIDDRQSLKWLELAPDAVKAMSQYSKRTTR